MKTVVVPVDFSETSLNAARYAQKMLTGAYGVELILYHMYEKKNEEQAANQQLSDLQKTLAKDSAVKTECIAVLGDDLIDEIERVVNHRHADMVVMGITGRTALEQVFMGSNTLKLVDKNACPVLIIPPKATYTGVKNVMLTSDFKNVRLTTPSVPIKAVLELFRPVLHVVNVDSAHYVSITEEYQKEKAAMQALLSQYNPEFYFIGRYDFQETVEQFITDKKIDILITIPRHHSVIGGLFKGSHTKKLVYHSTVPILAVHE
jgi:nucleotide-binding universal stress UspA family protein